MSGLLFQPFRTLAFAVFAFLAVLAIAPAHAYRVQPLSVDLTPATGANAETIRVENTTENRITVEISFTRRIVDANGVETETPADDLFLVLPPQALIEPGATQAFRMQYVGPPPAAGEAFRMLVSQLPVDLPEATGNQISFLFNFGINVYVQPPQAAGQIVASDVRASGTGMVQMVVENRGNKALSLASGIWKIRNAAGVELEVDKKTFTGMDQSFLIMPGLRRTFSLRAPEGLSLGGPLTATFTETAEP